MEASTLARPIQDLRYPRVATATHTILMLGALAIVTFWGKMFADQQRASVSPNRLQFYAISFCLEWGLFFLVLVGVRKYSGGSTLSVMGDPWPSFRQFLRDIAIAAAFWTVSAVLLVLLGSLLLIAGMSRPDMQFMVPKGGPEVTAWVVVSLTAGFCEETIFRGYLQRQFMAFNHSAPAGIILSAVVFGAAHFYQGNSSMLLIALYGAMFGILAHWRKSVRPGMIAHAWHDSLIGGTLSLLRR